MAAMREHSKLEAPIPKRFLIAAMGRSYFFRSTSRHPGASGLR